MKSVPEKDREGKEREKMGKGRDTPLSKTWLHHCPPPK